VWNGGKKGSQAMVSVNALFAGFSGALVAILIAFTETSCWIQTSIILALLSFILFALAAERITDALDEGEVTAYLGSMCIYNVAVVLLFASIAVFLFSRSYYVPGVIMILGSVYPWLNDIRWFIFAKTKDKQGYIEELSKKD
jgi:ABC-type cobalamin transport system permease subunit